MSILIIPIYYIFINNVILQKDRAKQINSTRQKQINSTR